MIKPNHTKNTDGLTIVVSGYLIRGPFGGQASCRLQYLLGLHQLGHTVYFVEDSTDEPSCYNPVSNKIGNDPTYGLQFARNIFSRAGLSDRFAYYDARRSQWLGPAAGRILKICESADLLLHIGGTTPLRPWLMDIPARALLDLDPAFRQARHLVDPAALRLAAQHTSFLTIGENIQTPKSQIPDDGLPWQPVRQPVVLDYWPVIPAPIHGRITTVMRWHSRPEPEYNGVRYGMKSESFGPYMELPQRTDASFELALGSASAPRELLGKRGWKITNPLEMAKDPWTYKRYIQGSKAEFGIAKHGYVESRCGWFSDRSAAYLASGRPVLAQETGFSRWLDAGAGVIPFSSLEDAIAGVEEINARYEYHCGAAREIAEAYFDSRKVLARLLENAINPPSPATPGKPKKCE